jgi:ABC-type lipoprotein export system ATPase subunit
MNERSDAELAIELRGVTRVFPGPVNALRGVDLKVAYNESVAITGPSGCGKSTLLHLLAAIDKPTAGTVSVAGQNVESLHDPSHFRRSEVGLVFQFHNLLPQLNALANIELPMFGTVRSAHARKERAQSLLEDVDLGKSGHRLPSQLSGGEQQRVAIARALANHPKILLADEPTGSLDSANTTRFLDLLDGLREKGMTIVTVTHATEVANRAHRVIEMRDGAVVGDHLSSEKTAISDLTPTL